MSYIGTQISLPGFLQFGVDPILDLVQEKAGVNSFRIHADDAIAPNRHLLSLESESPTFNIAGTPMNPANYRGTSFTPRPFMGAVPAARRMELFHEIMEKAHARGMTVHARVIIGPDREREAFSHLLAIDYTGSPIGRPCWNHPDYRAYLKGMAEDFFKTAPIKLDGWLQMNEDEGPLSDAFHAHMGKTPACFCEYCGQRAHREGLDMDRAKRGYAKLINLGQASASGQDPWSDGGLIGLLRIFQEFPEILGWQQMQQLANEETMRLVKGVMKLCHPAAELGHHVVHMASFTPVSMAGYDYSRLAEFCDHLCPLMYHSQSGNRFSSRVTSLKQRLFPNIPEEDFVRGYYYLMGLDPAKHPSWKELRDGDLQVEDYVKKETARVVRAANGRAKVYSNVGWETEDGVPAKDVKQTRTYRAVTAAIEAGADGIFLCRTFAPGLFFGETNVQTAVTWNAGAESGAMIEGDVGPNSLAAYGAALKDAGWVS